MMAWPHARFEVITCACALLAAGCTSSRPPEQHRSADESQSERAAADQVRALCEREKWDCRRNVRVVVRRTDGSTFDRTYDWLPPQLQGPWLDIFPGDTIRLEAEASGEAVSPRRIVAEASAPERTITFRFSQDEKNGMRLIVENPFPKALKYDLFMVLLDDDDPRSTSSCPVVPHGATYELWPHPIYMLVAANFRFVNTDSGMKCDAAPIQRAPATPR
jgi:hypothetical protein